MCPQFQVLYRVIAKMFIEPVIILLQCFNAAASDNPDYIP